MRIIAGLGNPGREYAGTRHNVGFEVLNKFAFDNKIEYRKIKCRAAVAEAFLFEQRVLLCKPHTYMNLSGESIAALMRKYGVTAEDVIVVYDDADIDLGEIRVRVSGSSGGHNGIKNIISHIGADFTRIRVGIGRSSRTDDIREHVLERFARHEITPIVEGITKAADAIGHVLRFGAADAMNAFNKRQSRD